MDIIGIIGEYNPFHNGHVRHIAESKALVGDNAAVIAVMSGNFVQRGDPAVFPKHARAHAAVLSGVDLVIELPVAWALSSAEGFARGAVALLSSLNVVSHLSFGSETGALEPLSEAAAALLKPDVDSLIRRELETGVSYATARQAALKEVIGDGADVISYPNNILAVEYIKAIYDMNLDMRCITVKRHGSGHDAVGDGPYRSASEIRSRLASGLPVGGMIPAQTAGIYAQEEDRGRGPVTVASLEQALLSRLRMLPQQDYESLPDSSEGLGNRLYRASREGSSIDAVLGITKTKRYALSRLRRMLMCACLGIRSGMTDDLPPYARILAANGKGRELLRLIGDKASVPVITRPGSVRQMDKEIRQVFELEAGATDLYALGYGVRDERRAGLEWITSPVIIEEKPS